MKRRDLLKMFGLVAVPSGIAIIDVGPKYKAGTVGHYIELNIPGLTETIEREFGDFGINFLSEKFVDLTKPCYESINFFYRYKIHHKLEGAEEKRKRNMVDPIIKHFAKHRFM